MSSQTYQWNHDYARLQACVAHAYELDAGEFAHVLSTLPLVDAATKEEAFRYFKENALRPPPAPRPLR